MSAPCRGRIVWAVLTDPQGRNPKLRPGVIVTPTEEIQADAPESSVLVVAISTRIGAARPEESVELPWHRDRHPRTGLKQRCVAVCSWLRQVRLRDIQEYAGVVPGRQLLEILRKVGSLPI